jgi:hypothetical protein
MSLMREPGLLHPRHVQNGRSLLVAKADASGRASTGTTTPLNVGHNWGSVGCGGVAATLLYPLLTDPVAQVGRSMEHVNNPGTTLMQALAQQTRETFDAGERLDRTLFHYKDGCRIFTFFRQLVAAYIRCAYRDGGLWQYVAGAFAPSDRSRRRRRTLPTVVEGEGEGEGEV